MGRVIFTFSYFKTHAHLFSQGQLTHQLKLMFAFQTVNVLIATFISLKSQLLSN
jgi:hypothetical protein